MPSKHKRSPIPFRPPEGDEAWLKEHARRTGQAVNAILAMLLARYRREQEGKNEP